MPTLKATNLVSGPTPRHTLVRAWIDRQFSSLSSSFSSSCLDLHTTLIHYHSQKRKRARAFEGHFRGSFVHLAPACSLPRTVNHKEMGAAVPWPPPPIRTGCVSSALFFHTITSFELHHFFFFCFSLSFGLFCDSFCSLANSISPISGLGSSLNSFHRRFCTRTLIFFFFFFEFHPQSQTSSFNLSRSLSPSLFLFLHWMLHKH